MQCEEFVLRPAQQGQQRLNAQCIEPLKPPNLSVNCNPFVPCLPRAWVPRTLRRGFAWSRSPVVAPNLGVRDTSKGTIISAGGRPGLHKSPLHGQFGMETSRKPGMPSAHHPRGGQPQVPCGAWAPEGARSKASLLPASMGTCGGGRLTLHRWVFGRTGTRGAWVCVQARRWT